MKYFVAVSVLFLQISCSEKSNQLRKEKLGFQEFLIKDTICTIKIGHCDITECLDAEILTGNLYYSDSVYAKVKEEFERKNYKYIFVTRDIYLSGKKDITFELFDTILCPKMGNQYLVKGKVVDFKNCAAVFRVDSFQLFYE